MDLSVKGKFHHRDTEDTKIIFHSKATKAAKIGDVFSLVLGAKFHLCDLSGLAV
jgi:hypothetical protein